MILQMFKSFVFVLVESSTNWCEANSLRSTKCRKWVPYDDAEVVKSLRVRRERELDFSNSLEGSIFVNLEAPLEKPPRPL